MKRLCYALALVLVAFSNSHADVFIGRNLDDAQSGTAVNLVEGQSQTFEIWLGGAPDQNIRAISFNLLADAAGVVNSSNLLIDDLASRWPINNLNSGDPTASSASGLLIDDVSLATLGAFNGTGVTFVNGDPVRLGTIDISASMIGTTNAEFSVGSNGVRDQNGAADGFVTGGRTFNVTAVPEPGAIAVLGIFAGIAAMRRRRS